MIGCCNQSSPDPLKFSLSNTRDLDPKIQNISNYKRTCRDHWLQHTVAFDAVHKVVEQPNAFAHDSDEPADDQSEINNRTVVGTSTAVASGILKTMDISSGGRESNKPARNSVDPSALKTVDISYSGAHTDADVPTGPLDTVDLSSNSARSKESAPEGFPVPLNEHANPPGHDPQQAAVAAATGAVAASAAPIGVASVDRTGSAVDLSSSGSASDDQSPANPSDAERTVDVTGAPQPGLYR